MTDVISGAELLSRAMEAGEKIFEGSGELVSRFLAEASDGKLLHITTPWRNEGEKQLMIDQVRQLFQENSVIRYVLISEVWMVNRKGSRDEFRGLIPSECEDRTEHVQWMMVDRDGSVQSVTREILRDGDSPRLGEPKTTRGLKITGRMANLLTGDPDEWHQSATEPDRTLN